MNRRVCLLILLITLLPTGYFISRWLTAPTQPKLMERTTAAIELLKKELAATQESIDQDVKSYRPAITGDINSLDTQAADLLQQIPGVEEVEVRAAAGQPTHRIIHILDAHYVPLDLYRMDVESQGAVSYSDEEIRGMWEALMLEVEILQTRQRLASRCLGLCHGLQSDR